MVASSNEFSVDTKLANLPFVLKSNCSFGDLAKRSRLTGIHSLDEVGSARVVVVVEGAEVVVVVVVVVVVLGVVIVGTVVVGTVAVGRAAVT